MTYDELRTMLRRDLLAEASQDYWSDDDLFGYLKRAATGIAREMGFPTRVHSVFVPQGASEVALPDEVADVQVNEVAFGGFRLALAPWSVVSEYQELGALRFPRYYNVDPKRQPALLTIAPPAPDGGATLRIEYVVEYDPATEAISSPPWEGKFLRFHELVAYRAAVEALAASMEDDRSAAMQQRLMPLMQAFALFLGKADLAQAMAGPGTVAS